MPIDLAGVSGTGTGADQESRLSTPNLWARMPRMARPSGIRSGAKLPASINLSFLQEYRSGGTRVEPAKVRTPLSESHLQLVDPPPWIKVSAVQRARSRSTAGSALHRASSASSAPSGGAGTRAAGLSRNSSRNVKAIRRPIRTVISMLLWISADVRRPFVLPHHRAEPAFRLAAGFADRTR